MDIAIASGASSRRAGDTSDDECKLTIGADELAEGLMLVRASNINVVRLQLALERRDRRVALEAVDDLVALDDRLQELVGRLPTTGELILLERDLDHRRSALAREKLTLAAGMSGRAAGASTTVWRDEVEAQPGERRSGPPCAVEPEGLEADSGGGLRISLAARVGVLLALLSLALAVTVLVLGPSGVEAVLAGLNDRAISWLGEGLTLR